MSTQPQPPLTNTTLVPHRSIASMGTFRARGHYWRMIIKETVPPYESLFGVVEILAGVLESPGSWAHAKLREMTARNADWKALESAPPNDVAKKLALRVLKSAHALRPLEPSYITASAEGGVGIVYRSKDKYAAFECRNAGDLRLLWFDLRGDPHSIRVKPQGIELALKRVAAIHTPNARTSESR